MTSTDNGHRTTAAITRPFVVPGCAEPRHLDFTYLNFHEHPRGTAMLDHLLRAGFRPRAVIDEVSDAARRGRQTQLNLLRQASSFREAAPTAATCAELGIRYETVANHNSAETTRILQEIGTRISVLGDTRVLKKTIIENVMYGILNVHPGVLPDVRGNNPYIWSIIHDLPFGASMHLINTGVDLGPILLTRQISIEEVGTLPELVHLINELCGEVAVEGLTRLVHGHADLTDQPDDGAPTFRGARPEIWTLAETILGERAAARSAKGPRTPPVERHQTSRRSS